jgi:hypothetical protein
MADNPQATYGQEGEGKTKKPGRGGNRQKNKNRYKNRPENG